jgi:hypothetical protein
VNTDLSFHVLTIYLATAERLTTPDDLADIFRNSPEGEPVDGDAVVDDDKISNLAFKIPRQKVDDLRKNLLNIVLHYFDIHEGIFFTTCQVH